MCEHESAKENDQQGNGHHRTDGSTPGPGTQDSADQENRTAEFPYPGELSDREAGDQGTGRHERRGGSHDVSLDQA
jgi:hypothetical protein